ncbi:MAG: hypothetical protein NNA19_09720 [Nitrospira sp.]|nr:hypothetical protein [Nitrospira sp.]
MVGTTVGHSGGNAVQRNSTKRNANRKNGLGAAAAVWGIAISALICGRPLPASAHVSFSNAGTFNGTDVLTYSQTLNQYKAFGWVDGTDADLGDSHQIGGLSARWYRFTLNQPGLVDISVIQNTAGLDPAFTLYRGAFPLSAHDDTVLDPLNPVDPVTFAPIQSPIDADPTGLYLRHSGYRDTVNQTYEGQFDAFGDWSMANDGGQHVKVEYVIAVAGTSDSDPVRGLTWGGNGNHDTAVGTGESLLQYYLPPGTYSVAIGGERCNDGTSACTGSFYSATFSLRVEPVPIPAASWLMGSALSALGLWRWGRDRHG